MNVLGYISIYASTIYAATLILGATCSIGSDGAFVATKYQNYGMFVATTLLTFGMTCVSSNLLNKLNISYICIQFAMLLALIIALAAGTPNDLKNTASVVFADFEVRILSSRFPRHLRQAGHCKLPFSDPHKKTILTRLYSSEYQLRMEQWMGFHALLPHSGVGGFRV